MIRKTFFLIHQSIHIVSELLVIGLEEAYVYIKDENEQWECDY